MSHIMSAVTPPTKPEGGWARWPLDGHSAPQSSPQLLAMPGPFLLGGRVVEATSRGHNSSSLLDAFELT